MNPIAAFGVGRAASPRGNRPAAYRLVLCPASAGPGCPAALGYRRTELHREKTDFRRRRAVLARRREPCRARLGRARRLGGTERAGDRDRGPARPSPLPSAPPSPSGLAWAPSQSPLARPPSPPSWRDGPHDAANHPQHVSAANERSPSGLLFCASPVAWTVTASQPASPPRCEGAPRSVWQRPLAWGSAQPAP